MTAEPPSDLPLALARCGRLPLAGDNAAIATRALPAGQAVDHRGLVLRLSAAVLEGHRFLVEPVASGAELLSWGLPFGRALRPLEAGAVLCNARLIEELGRRELDADLPSEPNFEDASIQVALDEARFSPGQQVVPHTSPGSFRGFARPGGRGVGTRNFALVLGLTSRVGAFAEALAARFEGHATDPERFDGVVGIAHTEGGGAARPLNLEFVLRALAGFCVHPNAGGVLVVDDGEGAYDAGDLRAFMLEHGYPSEHVPLRFFQVGRETAAELDRAAAEVQALVLEASAAQRTEEALSNLRIALQCGGSDAFSGISGNALAGWMAKECLRHGGSANLAETDELIGAEPYVLANVRDLQTARRFLGKIETFKARAARHGASAEGNPSGGNILRGLYNITLKSIGAARKKDPEVRLDHVLDYGQPMQGPGFYFMDSPGNDLESIAGQVACGANLILFITGNGSITNFPFVPTLKVVTTTPRFELLSADMDINAGRFNDGMAMDELGRESFELARRVISGERSRGELAGHAQVSLWREWRRAEEDEPQAPAAKAAAEPADFTGKPVELRLSPASPQPALEVHGELFDCPDRGVVFSTGRVGLIMPTSLCSGEIAKQVARRLNGSPPHGLRYVELAHTEGCGSAGAEHYFLETMLGYLRHPSVRAALLLEHGCEKTHNGYMRQYLASRGFDPRRLGFASVQRDGGIERVSDLVVESLQGAPVASASPAVRGVEGLRLGLASAGPLQASCLGADAAGGALGAEERAGRLGRTCAGLLAAGAQLVMPAADALLELQAFRMALGLDHAPRASSGYGAEVRGAGLHLMHCPTSDFVEVLSGLGATGIQACLVAGGPQPPARHPFLPCVGIGTPEDPLGELRGALGPLGSERECADSFPARFQLTRGEAGISL